MTEQQVCEWLGYGWPMPPGKSLHPDIAEGLADVPAPGSIEDDASSADGGHTRVFLAFLACAGPALARGDQR